MSVNNNIRSNPRFEVWRAWMADLRGWFPELGLIVTAKRWCAFGYRSAHPIISAPVNDNGRRA